MFDVGKVFGSLIDPVELAKKLITQASGTFARPLVRSWYLGLNPEVRIRFARKFRQLGQAMDVEPPTLEQLQDRRLKLEAQIHSYQEHGKPPALDLETAADDVAHVGGEIIEEIKL